MKNSRTRAPLMAAIIGLAPLLGTLAPSASAADISGTFSPTLTTTVKDHGAGTTVAPGEKITFSSPNFSVPTTVAPGDSIVFNLPEYLEVDPGTNINAQNVDGGFIGTIKATGSHQYTLTFGNAVQANTGAMVVTNLALAAYPVIGGGTWAMGTSKAMGYTVNGKSIDSGISLVAAPSTFVNSAALVQNDVSGPGMQFTQTLITNTKAGVVEKAPLGGPHHVAMRAGAGLRFDCASMRTYGVPTFASNFSKTQAGNLDGSSTMDATSMVTYASCSDDTLTFDAPLLSNEDGTQYDYVQYRPMLDITPAAYLASQKNFTVSSTVRGQDATGVARTATFTAEGVYTNSSKVPNGRGEVSIQSYLNDANTESPTGTTANGQDSDADDYPGEDILAGAYKTTIVVENRGYKDLTNLSVSNLNGDVVREIPSLKVGEKVTFTVDATLTGGVGGEYYGDTYSVSADSTNGTLWATDGVNATVYTKATGKLSMQATINGQDANSPISLAPGTYPVEYRVSNPNDFPITLTSITGIDGKNVPLSTPITVAAKGSTVVKGINVSLAPNQKVGGVAKAVATYSTGLPDVLGGDKGSLEVQDGAYATGAVKPPSLGADTYSTAYNTPYTGDVLSNDKADVGLKLNAASLALLDGAGKNVSTLTTASGTFTVASGKITFAPKAGFTGAATAKYSVADELGNISQGTITVNVGAAPTTATAVEDAITLEYNKAGALDVLANDSATKGWNASTLKLLPATGGTPGTSVAVSGGTLSVNNGKILVTPNAGFTGTMGAARYQITSTDGKVATATIKVTVKAAPIVNKANPDIINTKANRAVTLNVIANDVSEKGVDGNSLRLSTTSTKASLYQVTTTGGTYYMRKGGNVYFIPKSGFIGKAGAITYTVMTNDGKLLTSTVEAVVTK